MGQSDTGENPLSVLNFERALKQWTSGGGAALNVLIVLSVAVKHCPE
jgi:hypothetical protein